MGLFSWLRLQTLIGMRRKYYSVPLILICMCVAASTAAGVSILTTLWLRTDTGNRIYTQDVRACARQNAVRRESNQRIRPHIIDRDNLIRLAARLSRTRRQERAVYIREEAAFAGIGHAFHIERDVAPLLRALSSGEKVLAAASATDTAIVRRQKMVTFRPLAVIDCNAPGVVIHP